MKVIKFTGIKTGDVISVLHYDETPVLKVKRNSTGLGEGGLKSDGTLDLAKYVKLDYILVLNSVDGHLIKNDLPPAIQYKLIQILTVDGVAHVEIWQDDEDKILLHTV